MANDRYYYYRDRGSRRAAPVSYRGAGVIMSNTHITTTSDEYQTIECLALEACQMLKADDTERMTYFNEEEVKKGTWGKMVCPVTAVSVVEGVWHYMYMAHHYGGCPDLEDLKGDHEFLSDLVHELGYVLEDEVDEWGYLVGGVE